MNISLSDENLNNTKTNCPFRWETHSLKYLGINLTPRLTSLYEHNFPALLQEIKKDLKKWNNKYFSWFGRAAILKMVILPRLLYLLRSLPIKIPQSFFKALQSVLLEFLWGHKKARIKFQLLTRPKEQGGMGIPNFYNYYLASHLTRVIDWHCHTESKDWVLLEASLYQTPLKFSPLDTLEISQQAN